jgi:hypothetical protein
MSQTVANKELEVVKAQIFMAKQFPRDTFQAMDRILDAVKRPSLAQAAVYQYARGGSNISGPSIRLAEVAAQNWGNLDYGVRELERHETESVAQAYAWDLETNVRVEKTFTVPHVRDTRSGSKALTSDRDIYELVANNGARRLRAAIMEVIPGDVFEKAVQVANQTLAGQSDQPLSDRIAVMLKGFDESYGVTKEMIERKVQRKAEAISERQYAMLIGIAQSLKDGMGTIGDFFEVAEEDPEADKLADKFAGKPEPAKQSTPKTAKGDEVNDSSNTDDVEQGDIFRDSQTDTK